MAKIAILEDDIEYLKLIETVLRRRGHATVGFAGARDALEYLGAHSVDLIVSDIFVRKKGFARPDGGVSLVWGLKQLPLQRRNMPPILVMTGVRDDDAAQAALDAMKIDQSTLVLFKPFDPQMLVERVDQLLAGVKPVDIRPDAPAPSAVPD